MCVQSLELGCPLLLALQEHYNKQEKTSGIQIPARVLVMFEVGLSGDPTKAVAKWQSGTGSICTQEP